MLLLVPKSLKYQGMARVSQTLGGLSDTILMLSGRVSQTLGGLLDAILGLTKLFPKKRKQRRVS